MISNLEIIKRLMNVLWLRPESVLWYSEVLSNAAQFLGKTFQSPSLEFGCMDGINTVILLGGDFDRSFDMYTDVSWEKNSHKKSTLKDDYFNKASENVEVKLSKNPESKFDYGISWKDAHLKKAARTKVFKELIKIDISDPSIPLDDGLIKTIWAPNIYWSENLTQTLFELNRVLAIDGRIITVAPDIKQLEYMLYRFADDSTRQWLSDLDRERYKNVSRHAHSYQDWKKIFLDTGLRINKHKRFINPLNAIAYDIGFRPMFPVFMNMYEKMKAISEEAWLDVKNHWIDTVLHFITPLCDNIVMDYDEREKVCHIFELVKIK